MRYAYGYGYKTRERAEDALDDMIATGEVSEGENPRIEVYTVADKVTCRPVTRFRVTLSG